MTKNKEENPILESEVDTAEEINETDRQTEQKAEDDDNKDNKDKEIEKLKDQLLRQLAEYDNYRKRTAKERMDTESAVISRTVTEFLPVLDNLERALAHECSDESYKKGVQMIYDSFCETLQKLGVEEIETNGAEFNPTLHQAVQQVENDELESGTICETFQKGYKIGDKIIRFAMVAVVS